MKDSLFAIQVSVSEPREKFINERSSHNKSFLKGVWGKLFFKKVSAKPSEP
jgi:hypothetical protein